MPIVDGLTSDARLKRLRQGAYPYCVTQRCGLNCTWCGSCRPDAADAQLDRAPSGSPGDDRRVIRLHGGDAFRYGDLQGWVAWARGNARAWIEVEGAAAALGSEDGVTVAGRLVEAAPDGVVVQLPTMDAARTVELTGRAWEPARALDRLAELGARGLAIVVVVPVNAATVSGVHDVVLAAAERLGAVADIVIRRAPSVRGGVKRLPLAGDNPAWEELERLSTELAMLPAALPAGPTGTAQLHMDADLGYAACMLRPEARRADLVPARGDSSERAAPPLGDVCGTCAWQLRCLWTARAGAPSRSQVLPLLDEEATALQEQATDPTATHRPHAPRARWSRSDHGLPELLCVAPWTSMSATETPIHPVPCAMSWVQNAVPTGDAAAAMGISVDQQRATERRAADELRGVWYCLDNPEVSLDELWNNPLLRVMRAQMLGGGPTKHCRSMCRTVMGVDDRGADLLARPDSELTPAIVENRRLLMDEIRAGKAVLSARPLELICGVASRCNIDCGFCHGPLGEYGELSDARRDEIIAWLPTLMSFSVSGPGEPLMSKNYLLLLDHIADHCPAVSVALTTNGTLLTPQFLERHATVRWGHVRISLNAGSSPTHERMTGKKLWGRVIENLDALCALRDTRTPPFEITLSCVLSEMVMGDLHSFAELVTQHRTRVVVEPMYGDMKELSPWTRPERLRPLADELHSVADAFVLRNPPLSKAFRAVQGFAEARLASGSFAILEHH